MDTAFYLNDLFSFRGTLYIASFLWITDAMVADAQEEAPWVSRAYSAVVPAPQMG